MSEEQCCVRNFLAEIQQGWGKGDVYRDSPIRYLGYANEVGESLRAWVPVTVVRASYVAASAYVLADGLDKSHQVYKRPFESRVERQKRVGLTLLDTLAWQAFASVIVPGFTVNRFCAGTTFLLKKFSRLSPTLIKTWTTFLGLAIIPFIVRPIDALVEMGMDRSLRKVYDLGDSLKPANS